MEEWLKRISEKSKEVVINLDRMAGSINFWLIDKKKKTVEKSTVEISMLELTPSTNLKP